ncbi:hypothetical protein BGY98DRAFT_232232 [Russula aff. rugulosa BPL654]|nr:hypothetical protein BGY98DRAFT_232232 [Russula aff. rugulosa BPL654]
MHARRAHSAIWCLAPPMIALRDFTDVGHHTGMYLTILSVCSLAGPPISGTIHRATGGYSVVGTYAQAVGFPFFYPFSCMIVSLRPEWGRCLR